MASNVYIQNTSDGKRHLARRSIKQGRKPSGLSSPELVRLYAEDQEKFDVLKNELGYLYNKNEIIRTAVHKYLETVYTQLLKR